MLLSPQSLSSFTDHLRSGSVGLPTIEFRKGSSKKEPCQMLYLKYLIGSAAIFGKVDERALDTLRKAWRPGSVDDLSELLDELAKSNNSDMVAGFIASRIRASHTPDLLRHLVVHLVKTDWGVVETLIMKTLAILEREKLQDGDYCFILRRLSVGRQYEMINAGSVSMEMLHSIYSFGRFDVQLREVFFLARCSYSPNSRIREYVAAQDCYFEQFLPDCTIKNDSGSLCPGNIPSLNADTWLCVFMFLDAETLVLVLPLVCTAWRRLHSRALTCSQRIHDFYLQDLSRVELSQVHTIAPWKYCLMGVKSGLRYFGQCVLDGALGRTKANDDLRCAAREYLRAVLSGEISLPMFEHCTSTYDSFLRLFEMVCEFCAHNKPALRKPSFLTDAEYERAIGHFVYKKRWILQLSESLVVNDMPRLFRIIREDEELMKRLLIEQFFNFHRPSIVLAMHGQMAGVPERLAKLVFSQAGSLRALVEPELISPREYYSFMVERGLLFELVANRYWMTDVNRLLISVVLFFKDDLIQIDKIVTSMTGWLSHHHDKWVLGQVKSSLKWSFSEILMDTEKYPPGDVEFFKRTMVRFTLLDKSEIQSSK